MRVSGKNFTDQVGAVYTEFFLQVPNMYAIVQAGGRQIRVSPGSVATIDGTAGQPGAELTYDQVLLVEKDGGEVLAGAPFVANAKIIAVVEGESRGPKIRIFKKKRRKGMRRTTGHRAVYTRVRIKDILL
jgi:large subunit ribosomal protein L21